MLRRVVAGSLGKKVKLKALRGDKSETVNITPSEWLGGKATTESPLQPMVDRGGVASDPASPRRRSLPKPARAFRTRRQPARRRRTSVEPRSAARKPGPQIGDVIETMQLKAVTNPAEIAQRAADALKAKRDPCRHHDPQPGQAALRVAAAEVGSSGASRRAIKRTPPQCARPETDDDPGRAERRDPLVKLVALPARAHLMKPPEPPRPALRLRPRALRVPSPGTVNHALGLISFRRRIRSRSRQRSGRPVGTFLLYGSALVHMGLALHAVYERRTLRMPFRDLLRIVPASTCWF